MTQMNQLTCAVKEIAPLDGRDVQASRTTVAYPNGCSAMEKTIVAITAMNFRKTALFANLKLTISVKTTDVFLNSGLVTLLMIAVMVLMNQKHSAKENTGNVPSRNSIVTTGNAFLVDGDVVSFFRNSIFFTYLQFSLNFISNIFSFPFHRPRRRLRRRFRRTSL